MFFEGVYRDLTIEAGNCYKILYEMHKAFLSIHKGILWLKICIHLLAFINCVNLKELEIVDHSKFIYSNLLLIDNVIYYLHKSEWIKNYPMLIIQLNG